MVCMTKMLYESKGIKVALDCFAGRACISEGAERWEFDVPYPVMRVLCGMPRVQALGCMERLADASVVYRRASFVRLYSAGASGRVCAVLRSAGKSAAYYGTSLGIILRCLNRQEKKGNEQQ